MTEGAHRAMFPGTQTSFKSTIEQENGSIFKNNPKILWGLTIIKCPVWATTFTFPLDSGCTVLSQTNKRICLFIYMTWTSLLNNKHASKSSRCTSPVTQSLATERWRAHAPPSTHLFSIYFYFSIVCSQVSLSELPLPAVTRANAP